MPYLHWERAEDFQTLEAIIGDKKKMKPSGDSGIPEEEKGKRTGENPLSAQTKRSSPPISSTTLPFTADGHWISTITIAFRTLAAATKTRLPCAILGPRTTLWRLTRLLPWSISCGCGCCHPVARRPRLLSPHFHRGALGKNPGNTTALVSNIF